VWRGRNGLLAVSALLAAMFTGSLLTLLWIGPEAGVVPVGADRREQTEVEMPQDGLTERQKEKLDAAYRLILREFYRRPDGDRLVDGAIRGMVEALGDPHSAYLSPEEARQLEDALQPSFQGVGAEVTMENGRVTVVSAIRGSPADKAGLRPKDVILSVNGESLEGLGLVEAVNKIRGPKGTQAKLEVLRGQSVLHLTIVRDEVGYETVYAARTDDGIVRIEIRQFAVNTKERFMEHLEQMEREGVRGLVIDLRNNPGGVLTTATGIAEAFVPPGRPIMYTEERDGAPIAVVSRGQGQERGYPVDYPIVVLVNRGSASAAEVLAAALRESAGALLVGETTYGKGTVQYPFTDALGDGSLIKLTVKKWLTPSGRWIEGTGLVPDREVAQPAIYAASFLTKAETLRRDVAGADVRNAQLMLDGLGFSPGRTDGYFDDRTEEAVRLFQQRHGLPVTGEVDPTTARRLEEETARAIRDPGRDSQWLAALEEVRARATDRKG